MSEDYLYDIDSIRAHLFLIGRIPYMENHDLDEAIRQNIPIRSVKYSGYSYADAAKVKALKKRFNERHIPYNVTTGRYIYLSYALYGLNKEPLDDVLVSDFYGIEPYIKAANDTSELLKSEEKEGCRIDTYRVHFLLPDSASDSPILQKIFIPEDDTFNDDLMRKLKVIAI